jgi:hypothetical protein
MPEQGILPGTTGRILAPSIRDFCSTDLPGFLLKLDSRTSKVRCLGKALKGQWSFSSFPFKDCEIVYLAGKY